jgi:hypothetical protein
VGVTTRRENNDATSTTAMKAKEVVLLRFKGMILVQLSSVLTLIERNHHVSALISKKRTYSRHQAEWNGRRPDC